MGAELVWKNTRYAEWRGTGKSLGIGCVAVQISPRPRAGERIVVQAPSVIMVAGDRVVTVADVVLGVSPAAARKVALLLLKTHIQASGRDDLTVEGVFEDDLTVESVSEDRPQRSFSASVRSVDEPSGGGQPMPKITTQGDDR